MTTRVLELFGQPTTSENAKWSTLVTKQQCPFTGTRCIKIRKSDPSVSIGTCTVGAGAGATPLLICPHRLLERRQVFIDCLKLLTAHEQGNELHIVSEVEIPGGSIDYMLVSARDRKPRDFVGIELQTLDTTGTVWPERQRFLRDHGLRVLNRDVKSDKGFGVNWKMTAKTILVQMHHKVRTFEHVNRKLVLVVQDVLLEYMRREFSFDHLTGARIADPLHIHAYKLGRTDTGLTIAFDQALSTDSAGVASALGLKADARVDLEVINAALQAKISDRTLGTSDY